MASVVRGILKSIKDKGVGTFWRELKEEGYLKCLPDGNLLSAVSLVGNGEPRVVHIAYYSNFKTLSLELKDTVVQPMEQILFKQTKIHNIGATLVGVDKFGNKYYQRVGEETQYGRHRWVEYAEKGRYNASQVPPEWHGWLHHITDHTGDELLMQKPSRYGIEHKENFSGEGEEFIYHSKGHALNPGQRDWTRYQSWQPSPK